MKKNFLPVLFLSALAAPFSVNADAASDCDYRGLYLGLSAGVTHNLGKFAADVPVNFNSNDGNLNNNIVTTNGRTRVGQVRELGGIAVGYSWLCDRIYIGAELGGYYAPTDLKINPNTIILSTNSGSGGSNSTASLGTSVKASLRKWEWTADVTPGVLFCDTFLVFGRVGIGFNRTRLQGDSALTSVSSDQTNNPNVSVPLSASTNQIRASWRLGLGLSNYISDNLVLTVNYVYTNYGKVTLTGNSLVAIPLGGGMSGTTNALLNTTVSTRVQRHAVLIGLNYYFNALFN